MSRTHDEAIDTAPAWFEIFGGAGQQVLLEVAASDDVVVAVGVTDTELRVGDEPVFEDTNGDDGFVVILNR